MGYRKSILPGFSKYKESPLKKEKRMEGPKDGEGKVGKMMKNIKVDVKQAEYDKLPLWKKVFTTPPNVYGGYAPGVGKLSKGTKKIFDTFNKIAQNRKKQSKIIEESLKKKGWKIHPSKTTHGKGKKNSPLKMYSAKKVAKFEAADKKAAKEKRRAERGGNR